MVNNLSQLKKALAAGVPFQIVEHFMHQDYTGQIRIVQKMQTNGMYTGIYGEPGHKVSMLNDGRGCWCSFGKASDWTFLNGLAQLKSRGRPIMTIRLIQDAI